MIKNIDIEKEVPIEIKDVEKTELIKDILYKEKKVKVISDFSKYSYMIFAFQKLVEKYGLNVEMVLALLYMSELKLFRYSLRVENKNIVMKDYLMFGLVELEQKYKSKNLYKLTEKANQIVLEFNEHINNSDNHISKNRHDDIELDVGSNLKDSLSSYFNV